MEGGEKENSLPAFLEKSFCGHRISMSGLDSKTPCSKSVSGDKSVCKKYCQNSAPFSRNCTDPV